MAGQPGTDSQDRVTLLIDVNLSPDWVPALNALGTYAVQWSTIGPGNTMDSTILEFAVSAGFVILTRDLDFGDILAATHAAEPSVIQLLLPDTRSSESALLVASAIAAHRTMLSAGALLTIHQNRTRISPLPL